MTAVIRKVRQLAPILVILALVATTDVPVGGQPSSPELQVAFSVGPSMLEARLAQGTPAQSIIRMIYEPLLYHDRDGKFVPALARSWRKVNETTLEFKLQENVRFTNGEPFTSESVKYTIESIIAPDSRFVGNRASLLDIERVETPDPLTVRVITKQVSRPLLYTLTFWPLGMLPPKAGAELGARLSAQPVGTGPYKLVEFTPGQRVVLEVNPGYWGKKPYYSKITYNVIPENGTRVAALESGRVMMINNVPPDQVARLRRHPDLSVIARPTARIMFLSFRMVKPIVRDVRFRQAVNVAINRRAIVNGILGGTAKVATSPLPSMVWGATDLPEVEYNPARARELLQQAGYRGEPFELYVPNGRFVLDKQIGEAIAGYLQAVGINVRIHVQEVGQVLNEWYSGSAWDGLFYGWGIITFDPDWLFTPMFHSSASPGKYQNRDLDALIDVAKTTTDEVKALQYYKAIQQVLWRELPFLFLYYNPQIDAVNRRLRGYEAMPDEFMFFDNTTLQSR